MPRYSSLLMQHFQTPRNAGALEKFDGLGEASLNDRAPRMRVYLSLENGLVARAGFETFGCGVSIACGSALTEMIIGKSLLDCQAISEKALIESLEGVPQEKRFCADLAIQALKKAAANCAANTPA